MMLAEKIRDKRVLFVPIYSMRNYQTGQYELEHDGNYNRVLSLLAKHTFTKADVLIPANAVLPKKPNDVDFIVSASYGKNAKATRDTENLFDDVIALFEHNKYDIIVVEPNALTLQLIAHFRNITMLDKLVYWCVASATECGTPWFVQEYASTDKQIASTVVTACASQSQVEYLQGKSYLEESFYNPEVFDYQTIFFPFRLTDQNYHANEFAEIVKQLQNTPGLKPFKVLYTDVNSSGLFDNFDNFVRVSSDHDTYLQVLKGRPIIPYLENDNMLEHVSIHEFLYYNCKVIMLNQKHKRDNPNIIYIDNINCLLKTLCELLEVSYEQI